MSTRFCTAVLQVHGVAAANTRHTTKGQEHIINQCSASCVRSRMSQRRGRESTVRSWGSDPCLRTTVELFKRTTQNSGTRCQSPFHHSWRQLIQRMSVGLYVNSHHGSRHCNYTSGDGSRQFTHSHHKAERPPLCDTTFRVQMHPHPKAPTPRAESGTRSAVDLDSRRVTILMGTKRAHLFI